jgi:hypothetical protein
MAEPGIHKHDDGQEGAAANTTYLPETPAFMDFHALGAALWVGIGS